MPAAPDPPGSLVEAAATFRAGVGTRCARPSGSFPPSSCSPRSRCSWSPTRSIGPPTPAPSTSLRGSNTGDADAARTILTAIAAAIITVVGVVFSVTILALTLASTQFGPRMLRNFIRDRGTQATLGIFVATFVFSVLALGSVTSAADGNFVPHISVTVALGLTLLDLGVLIYFIHHVATLDPGHRGRLRHRRDLDRALTQLRSEIEYDDADPRLGALLGVVGRAATAAGHGGRRASGVIEWLPAGNRPPRTRRVAAANDAVVRMAHRPGHFVVRGRPLAAVWPPEAVPGDRHRIRARAGDRTRTARCSRIFSSRSTSSSRSRCARCRPAVNDTFTALTCIDWLGDALCKLTTIWDTRWCPL